MSNDQQETVEVLLWELDISGKVLRGSMKTALSKSVIEPLCLIELP